MMKSEILSLCNNNLTILHVKSRYSERRVRPFFVHYIQKCFVNPQRGADFCILYEDFSYVYLGLLY